MNNSFFWTLIVIIFASCVPHKDLVYFQGEPMTKENIYKLNNTPYKLEVNDIINIEIVSENSKLVALFKNTNTTIDQTNASTSYYSGYSIDQHGNIRIPYIGDINVLGYTTKEVREKIEIELKKYISHSNKIFVKVKLSGIKYTILGEVKQPGTQTLTQNEVNIIEVISKSGGILSSGNNKQIEVLRKEFDGIKKYTIDLTQIDLFDSKVFNILPNDIIYVKPFKRKSWGLGTTGIDAFQTFSSVFAVITTTYLLIKTL
ncbi:polysaccharide biosynthesis/export family protein [Flavicella sediminum]|uniref:polysaccharide biosynthesis/export family protein n=1 Tax=Flavicella sediminum TaxID=2585141 RepID=UPI001121DB9D|nr:polysaccharide biosynthesis/export family protein [Flavicella sediminum]